MLLDQPLDAVRGDDEFVDAHPTLVPRLVADVAPLRPVEHEFVVVGDVQLLEMLLAVTLDDLVEFLAVGMVGLLAFLAEGPDETLGEDAQEGIGEVERVDPHVEEADDRFRGAVRVERAEDEMARQRRLDAGLGRFEIAHLAHHDHVRVGPEEGAHGGGEVEADLRLHLDLAESVLGDFDGVLGRPDLPVGPVDLVEGGVQGGRLSRNRWGRRRGSFRRACPGWPAVP